MPAPPSQEEDYLVRSPMGKMPSIEVDGRYLLERTDYRAIFWEMLRDHMCAVPGTVDGIFPGYTSGNLASQELGLFTT